MSVLRKPLTSEYLYSSSLQSLNNGQEIDSGWIDMEQYEKYQFEGHSNTSGMTMVITSSRVNGGGQGDDVQTTTSINSTFHLFNVIARQRFMRFQWQNNSGGTITNCSMSIKGSRGSNDKLSVFPLSVDPTNFSQAALVRSVETGQQPDGDYVNNKSTGSAFSTSSTLSGGGIYTSSWVDTDGWNEYELFISSDVKSANLGIELQFTDDVQAGTPIVRATKKYSLTDVDINNGFLFIKGEPVLDGIRIKYTNGSSAQSSFFLDLTLRTEGSTNSYNSANALLVSDYNTEIALGNVNNYTIDTKFGRNSDIDSGPEDIWEGGGNYTGHPQSFTPQTVNVFSSSTADTSTGTGARTIRIIGLKTSTSTDYESEDITMNGTSQVTSTNSWWRVNRAMVLTAGSSGQNAGNITIRSTVTSSNVFAIVTAGYNQSTVAAYTVPYSKKALIKEIRCSLTRSSGAIGSGTILFKIRPPGGVYQSKRVFEVQTGAILDIIMLGGIVVEAGSDIKMSVSQVSDVNSIVEGSFEFILLNI